MRWALTTFTHYTGDDAMFENFTVDDYTVLDAPSLHDALALVGADRPLARIDDGDSPYGGVFTDQRRSKRYFKLNDFVRSNTLCYGLFAESVIDLPWNPLSA